MEMQFISKEKFPAETNGVIVPRSGFNVHRLSSRVFNNAMTVKHSVISRNSPFETQPLNAERLPNGLIEPAIFPLDSRCRFSYVQSAPRAAAF